MPSNDSTVIVFVVTGPQQSAPFADNFTSAAINPGKYVILNPDLDPASWQYNGSGNYNTGSARFPFFISPAGSRDELFLPPITVSNNQFMVFDLAHARYQFPGGQFVSNDTLTVLASTDCGGTWTVLWDKSGAAMATAPTTAGEYVPSSNKEWKNHSVSLAAYEGQSVLIKFLARSNYGNHVYIDNLNISNTATGTATTLETSLAVAPNPAQTSATASFLLETAGEVSAVLYNATGQVVLRLPAEMRTAGQQQLSLQTSGLASGIYTLSIQAGEASATTRLVIAQ